MRGFSLPSPYIIEAIFSHYIIIILIIQYQNIDPDQDYKRNYKRYCKINYEKIDIDQ